MIMFLVPTVLSATPSKIMRKAMVQAIQAHHPLLYCRVDGDGEPDEQMICSKMVRKGDPMHIVSAQEVFPVDDVLTVWMWMEV
jgi:hypothetical protein